MIREKLIQDQVVEYLQENGYVVFEEVPVLSNRIDLVATDLRKEHIEAIEVKVRNWKRAFQQAMFYQLCSHACSIAIWKHGARKMDFDLLEQYGIGAIVVDGRAERICDAKPSPHIHPSLLEKVKTEIYSREPLSHA